MYATLALQLIRNAANVAPGAPKIRDERRLGKGDLHQVGIAFRQEEILLVNRSLGDHMAVRIDDHAPADEPLPTLKSTQLAVDRKNPMFLGDRDHKPDVAVQVIDMLSGKAAGRRRGGHDDELGALESGEGWQNRVPCILTNQETDFAEACVEDRQISPPRYEPLFIEQPVSGEEELAIGGHDARALVDGDVGRGVVQVALVLLNESDHRIDGPAQVWEANLKLVAKLRWSDSF